MKILLDTTYFLPIYNVNVSVPNDCLYQISQRSHSFFYSDLVYFECNAKASKYQCENHNEITQELVDDKFWTELQSKNYHIWDIACFFKEFHNDFIDCLHYSTAIDSNMSYFLTEDKIFKKTVEKIKEKFAKKFPYYVLIPMISYSDYIQKFPIK